VLDLFRQDPLCEVSGHKLFLLTWESGQR